MSFAILTIVLAISLVLCSILDGLPNFLLSWAIPPRWLFLAAGLLVLAWVTGDR
ncbi:MAG: hypothetical protein AAF152_06550 [Cyanobacteria bacterium P01_A01_bin.114]